MDFSIRLDTVSKRFGDLQALNNISGTIRAGRLTGLVGPDGAGKTTLMRMLAALMMPDSGTVSVGDINSGVDAPGVHRLIGYMPQRFGLYEELSVQENLDLYAGLRNLDTSAQGEIFQRLLAFTGLAPFTKRLAGQLSGGMKQKLGLACALMSQPKILLLDEPSVGVDPVSRQDLWKMVQSLTKEGMAVVWSTAYLEEAERCDDVLLLDHGELIYTGVPAALTGRLEGRSYRVTHISGDRRRLLTRALQLDSVRDGVIQGSSVRLVFAEQADHAAVEKLCGEFDAQLVAVDPRFEDAFIDLLGGAPGGGSAIAAAMPEVEETRQLMVQCEDLTKRFGDFIATDNVSFEVRRGEILGLLGPNGAGKSTTFKMLCGLIKPTGGNAKVAGLDLRHSPAAAKIQLGYMAQKFSLYGLLSVQQNLEFFSGVYGVRGRAQRRRVREMIEVFELQPYLADSPDMLSLGFKQRLALACALMHRPKILFLDEPTSGVDPLTRREFWSHITGIVAKGVTVLVTTHFMDEAEYCDRVALVNRGQLIALDTPDGLKGLAKTAGCPAPTMEQAFIHLVEAQNAVSESSAA